MIGRSMRQAHRAAVSGFTTLVALGRVRQRMPIDDLMRARALAEVMGELCAVHGVRTVVSGRVPRGPSVLVSNHLSYLDPVVICPQAPCLPISKGEVSSWPLIGTGGRAFGVMFVERERPASRVTVLRRAIRCLESGVSVLNFPEGTTTDGREMLRFQRGIFGAARIARVPVVPVALRFESPSLAWTGNERFLPHYLRTAARPTTTAFVHFCEPIACGPYDAPERLARVARARIRDRLDTRGARHEPAERVRVSAPRSNAVLPAASR